MLRVELTAATTLPADGFASALVGRVWRPDVGGPSVVVARDGALFDVSSAFATTRDLCEAADPAAAALAASGERLGAIDDILANTPPDGRDPKRPWLIAPIDLQAIKAAGVTFATSLIERVIEERARGERAAAEAIRADFARRVGAELATIKPGSPAAERLKQALVEAGLWSQYLEVGIGPDAEIFTKSQPMSAVGTGADAGFHAASAWNNPEPEVVLGGQFAGRDRRRDARQRRQPARFRRPLGAAARQGQGPQRELRDRPVPAAVRRKLHARRRAPRRSGARVEGEDGFALEGGSSMAAISRDPAELVRQLLDAGRQYPDGAALFLGTMFAPVADRDAPGKGFTHKPGDIVTISADKLGRLVNRMRHSHDCPPWDFGAGALMRNLARRGLI